MSLQTGHPSVQTLVVLDPDLEPTEIHRQFSQHYDIVGDDVYFPVNHQQLRDLLGKLLTHLDAMALPDRTHKAARTLMVAQVWSWWDSVADNATTSYKGCIAPVVMANRGVVAKGADGVVVEAAPSNRWGWESEQQWLSGNPAQSNPA